MPLKRSHPQTEQKFKDAVLDLVADSGCGAIGVNAIAQKAGADKVLIYRYFDNLHGLLQTVAQQQKWLPQCEELVESLGTECNHAVGYLQTFSRPWSNTSVRSLRYIRSCAGATLPRTR